MDIDTDEVVQSSSSQQPSKSNKKQTIAPVDDAHPFDLDSYISNYSGKVLFDQFHNVKFISLNHPGRTAIDRLIHIIATCPSIAAEAFNLALQHIHQSRDPSLYQTVLSAYEQAALSNPDLHLLPADSIATLDTQWADEVMLKNQAERTKLEVELKTYTNNMIKESIRVSSYIPSI